jgi:hypothetical protein
MRHQIKIPGSFHKRVSIAFDQSIIDDNRDAAIIVEHHIAGRSWNFAFLRRTPGVAYLH